jgi:hypothetical protein
VRVGVAMSDHVQPASFADEITFGTLFAHGVDLGSRPDDFLVGVRLVPRMDTAHLRDATHGTDPVGFPSREASGTQLLQPRDHRVDVVTEEPHHRDRRRESKLDLLRHSPGEIRIVRLRNRDAPRLPELEAEVVTERDVERVLDPTRRDLVEVIVDQPRSDGFDVDEGLPVGLAFVPDRSGCVEALLPQLRVDRARGRPMQDARGLRELPIPRRRLAVVVRADEHELVPVDLRRSLREARRVREDLPDLIPVRSLPVGDRSRRRARRRAPRPRGRRPALEGVPRARPRKQERLAQRGPPRDRDTRILGDEPRMHRRRSNHLSYRDPASMIPQPYARRGGGMAAEGWRPPPGRITDGSVPAHRVHPCRRFYRTRYGPTVLPYEVHANWALGPGGPVGSTVPTVLPYEVHSHGQRSSAR